MRKKGLWRKTACVLLFSMAASAIAGCQVGETEVVISSSFSGTDVFRINEKTCSLATAKVFLANYQNIYGSVYDINLWEHEYGETSLEDYVKDVTISQLAQIMSMDLLAEDRGVTLNDEEVELVSQAAEAYYDSLTSEEREYMGANEACIRELYRQYTLANKIYQQLTSGISQEVSDDEARVMEAQQIIVSDKIKAEEAGDKLAQGGDFLVVAGSYNEAERSVVTFGRGDVPAEVEEVAFALEPDEVSSMIEADGNYYYIKCINNYNQKLTDANKQGILERRRQAAFDDVYESFVANLSSQLNEDLWDSIQVEVSPEITTDSFFEVYEEYFN